MKDYIQKRIDRTGTELRWTSWESSNGNSVEDVLCWTHRAELRDLTRSVITGEPADLPCTDCQAELAYIPQ